MGSQIGSRFCESGSEGLSAMQDEYRDERIQCRDHLPWTQHCFRVVSGPCDALGSYCSTTTPQSRIHVVDNNFPFNSALSCNAIDLIQLHSFPLNSPRSGDKWRRTHPLRFTQHNARGPADHPAQLTRRLVPGATTRTACPAETVVLMRSRTVWQECWAAFAARPLQDYQVAVPTTRTRRTVAPTQSEAPCGAGRESPAQHRLKATDADRAGKCTSIVMPTTASESTAPPIDHQCPGMQTFTPVCGIAQSPRRTHWGLSVTSECSFPDQRNGAVPMASGRCSRHRATGSCCP